MLAPMLQEAGHEPVLLDVRPLEGLYESLRGDVREPEDVLAATARAEIVVHAAGILGIQAATQRDFYDINLTGTFNVCEAAVRSDVRGIVFSSTMSVYKPHDQPQREDALTLLSEDTPPGPRDLYGYTKAASETMCRYYERAHGLPGIVLRYGMFSPEPFFPYGIRLLHGGVNVHDVARAVLASALALAEGRVRWDVFNVESLVPFSAEDAPGLLNDPLPVLDRYYPGASELLRERGVERLAPIRELYPMGHAAEALGFRPECNFDRWLEELRSRPREKTPKNPPWP